MISIRRIIWRSLLTLLALALLGALRAWPARAADATVDIVNFAFQPAALTVGLNATVVWTNRDIAAHTVTFNDGPDSGTLNTNDTFSRVFATPGTYNYICNIHPSMTGMVTVLEVPFTPRVWIPLIINDATGATTGVE